MRISVHKRMAVLKYNNVLQVLITLQLVATLCKIDVLR